MLIDGGPDPGRLLNVLDARLPPWDRRVDVLVLSHPHEDHAAGLPALAERYRIGTIFEPGMRGPGPGYRAFEAELAAHGVRTGRLSTGDRLALDDLDLRVLWPDRGAVPDTPGDDGTSINNVSIVLLGTFGRQRMLLAGDIEQGIDPTLVARRPPNVDLLKVAHHGSATSSTDALLSLLQPKVALVSVGAKNPYGHPARDTLDRLRAHGADVYRTDRNGSVEVELDGSGMAVSRERGDADAPAAAAAAISAVPFLACSIATGSVGRTTAAATAAARADGYDRGDARLPPDHGRVAPAGPRSPDVVPQTCPGGRGGGGVAGARRRGSRTMRSPRRRGGRAAARRRQDPSRIRSGPPAATRRRLGGVARPTRPP
jgi:competence protein ComEC